MFGCGYDVCGWETLVAGLQHQENYLSHNINNTSLFRLITIVDAPSPPHIDNNSCSGEVVHLLGPHPRTHRGRIVECRMGALIKLLHRTAHAEEQRYICVHVYAEGALGKGKKLCTGNHN